MARPSAEPWGERVRRAVAILAVLAALNYFSWRLAWTLNPQAFVYSLILAVAEVMSAISLFLFFFTVWRIPRRDPGPPPPGLRVDVFITTYDEEIDLVKKTILGALSIRYPHTTYVLDDGRRPAVETLCRALGCGYITRPVNEHAKAGNLNNALKQTDGEFIATFDADHVPLSHFLDRTLGYFRDERVAYVQTPQEFYNIDSLQHRVHEATKVIWDEQAMFYRLIQPGKDHWNAAFYCGSDAVLRREALDDVGGFATETVTEDLHTSVRIQARGWSGVYHDEVLAYGQAAPVLKAFSLQRQRWARGNVSVLFRERFFLFRSGLTLPQRLCYLSSVWTYFDGPLRLIFFLYPAITLLTGLMPIRTLNLPFLYHFVPYYGLLLLAFLLMGRGYTRYTLSERYNALKFYTFCKAIVLSLLPRRALFAVTPKGQQDVPRWTWVAPQILVAVLSMSAILVGVLAYVVGRPYDRNVVIANGLWAGFNFFLTVSIARFALRKVQRRAAFRFPGFLAAHYELVGAEASGPREGFAAVRDIHDKGLSLITYDALPAGVPCALDIHLPDGAIKVLGMVLRAAPVASGSVRVFTTSVVISRISSADADRIHRYAFEVGVPKFLEAYSRLMPLWYERVWARRRQSRMPTRGVRHPYRLPAFYRASGEPLHLGITENVSASGLLMLSYAEGPTAETPVTVSLLTPAGEVHVAGRVVRAIQRTYGPYRAILWGVHFTDIEATSRARLRSLVGETPSITAPPSERAAAEA